MRPNRQIQRVIFLSHNLILRRFLGLVLRLDVFAHILVCFHPVIDDATAEGEEIKREREGGRSCDGKEVFEGDGEA